jgi:hypothetical protein
MYCLKGLHSGETRQFVLVSILCTFGDTIDKSLDNQRRLSISRHLWSSARHVFMLSTVSEDGMKCLFGLASQLIYASQPMVAGPEMALHIGYLHMHTVYTVGQNHPSATETSMLGLIGASPL